MKNGMHKAVRKVNCSKCGRKVKRNQKFVSVDDNIFCAACVKLYKVKTKH